MVESRVKDETELITDGHPPERTVEDPVAAQLADLDARLDDVQAHLVSRDTVPEHVPLSDVVAMRRDKQAVREKLATLKMHLAAYGIPHNG